MQEYKQWYNRFGVRLQQQLITPRIFPFELFYFPKNAIWHFTEAGPTQFGPSSSIPFLSVYGKRLPIQHIIELNEISIGGRRLSHPPMDYIKRFANAEKGFKYTIDAVKLINDPQIPIVCNYGIIPHLYYYQDNYLKAYHEWLDIRKTACKTCAEITKYSNRQHFFFITIPSILPGYNALRTLEEKVNQSFFRIFDTPEKWELMEFYKWLENSDIRKSIFSILPTESFSKITCVFFYQSYWFAINLNYLKEWTVGEENPNNKAYQQFKPDHLQKLFLKSCLTLQSSSSVIISPAEQTASNLDQLELAKDSSVIKTPTVSSVNFLKSKVETSYDSADQQTFLKDDDREFDFSKVFEDADEDAKAIDHIDSLRKITDYRHFKKPNTSLDLVESDDEINSISLKMTREEIANQVLSELDSNRILINDIEAHAELRVIDIASYRLLLNQAKAAGKQPSPYDSKKTINEYCDIKKEDLSINEKKFNSLGYVPDQSMHSSTLTEFDSSYVESIMPKDIVGMTAGIQKAGIILRRHSIEKVSSILGDFEAHTIELRPIDGAPSTLRFKLPIVTDIGEFMVNGKKMHMRKQRGELPIRKINATTVSLTSYYGKVFVKRSDKKVNDSEEWLSTRLIRDGLSGSGEIIKNVILGNVFIASLHAPKIYSGMAQKFKRIDFYNCSLFFEYNKRIDLFGIDRCNEIESQGGILVGKTNNDEPIIVTDDNIFYAINDGNKVRLGSLSNLAGLDETNMPVDYAVLKVYRKEIPLGMVLCYYMGIDNVLTWLNCSPKILNSKERISLNSDEWALVFQDKKLIFSRNDQLASLLFAGFNEYSSSIRNYFYEAFNQNNVYLNVFEKKEITVRYLRELDLMDRLFIDPITLGLLKERNEPVTFIGLLFLANELINTDYHSSQYAMTEMRIKGYERFSGAIYQELVTSIRNYRSRNLRGKAKIEMSPYAVWRRITQDPSNMLVADINPIETLKQSEAVTYLGEGGRTKESMNKKSRTFDVTDIGVISESTPDSGNVGINTFTTASPLFTSLRGTTEPYDPTKHGGANMLSTSAVVSVGADRDDPKRVNFISIQQAHSISCIGNTQPIIRTGYEEVIAHRTSDIFAYMAKTDGKVISISEKGIIIEGTDNKQIGIELGRRYGLAEGNVYAHDIVTTLKENDNYKAGDPVAYNSGFFEPDVMNPRKIIWKCSQLVTTALCETTQTHEDSSAISRDLANKLETVSVFVRSFVVNFDQSVQRIVKIGSHVEPTDILLIIEDEVTASTAIFDEETIQTLQMLSNKAPKAKKRGIIDKIEVFYHGDKNDMSPSLKKITNNSDQMLLKYCSSVGKKPVTGEVTSDYRVEGDAMELDTAEIKFYISSNIGAGVGDKGVFANQLKTTFCEVLPEPIVTESGETVDAIFGRRSVQARIVLSSDIIGTTNVLLKLIGKEAAKLYFHSKN